MYKLVALDLDGTLLTNDSKISRYNAQMLNSMREKGVKVAFVTGRIYPNAKEHAKSLEIIDFISCCNGACLVDCKTDIYVYRNSIDRDILIAILNILQKYDLFYELYVENIIYSQNRAINFLSEMYPEMDIFQGNTAEVVIVEDLINMVINEVMIVDKIFVMSKNKDDFIAARDEITKFSSLSITSSGFMNFELTNQGVDKSCGLRYLEGYYNISREEIIAFGDNENDLSMLEYAGMGVAMENAVDIVKSKCSYITDSNMNDGVATALNKLIN